MQHIDLKYGAILATRLERFSIKSYTPYRANCRCPICGDSQKSKSKARGWLLQNKDGMVYFCHNCGASMSFGNFIRSIDPALFSQYIMDKCLDKFSPTKKKKEVAPLDKLVMSRPHFTKKGSPLLKIKKVSSLNFSHKAKKYIEKRQIPASKQYKLYYAEDFNGWVNSLIPGKLPDLKTKEDRLIFPFIDEYNKVFGFQGRAFNDDSLRYISIMLDESKPKIFGLDSVDFDRTYHIVEGPIDSLFLENSVAMAGADANVSGLRNLENAVFVFDNEPRNKQIVERMSKCLEKGYSIVIWPKLIVDKDINDMILSTNMNTNMLTNLMKNNTFSGLEGKLKLSEWRKT